LQFQSRGSRSGNRLRSSLWVQIKFINMYVCYLQESAFEKSQKYKEGKFILEW
jgi:hypothetical protein